ncbi:MAG: phosphoenolpyruvate--protein phosphotransferase [Ignavibacteriales bacterium]|nr:phosphoenolpyruvate--protein phosphotransferase [Ignavibacteriales bacterium]
MTQKHETILKGIAAAPGIAIGHAYLFRKELPRVDERTLEEPDILPELERLDRAIAKSEKELFKILSFAEQKLGDTKAKIFEAQVMILQDVYLLDAIKKRIQSEKKNAEFIVSGEFQKYADLMLAANNEYMHERAHDVEDLKNRIIRNLQQVRLLSKLEGSPIVIAHTLTPADTMILSRNNILGYGTDHGGVTSHAALISRALKIPSVVGVNGLSFTVQPDDKLILDGYDGIIILHPTQKRITEYEQKRQHFQQFESQLSVLKDLPAVTLDGKSIELSANIELPDEIDYVVMQGSQGVGLYRSETLLLNRDDLPTEEEQYQAYKTIADRMYPQRVIMRTFDVGGDKLIPDMAEEKNPFLGWRGIRMMLDYPDFFKAQLRAILRASQRNNVAIMFPMISVVQEVRKSMQLLEEAKEELRKKGVTFDENIHVGVMIEVPSAALMSAVIASEVKFLSIGTNDLTQYMLAVDRGNNFVSYLYHELEPAVLHTIKFVVENGHRKKVWVGVCGEMASNPLAVPALIGLGIDELSVVPSMLPEIKKIIRSLNYEECQKLAQTILLFATREEVEKCLTNFMHKNCPDIPLAGISEM